MKGGTDDPVLGPDEITYRDLVRRPFWSGAKVRRYLPTADREVHGIRRHRIRIWLLSRVEAVEALPEFSPRRPGGRPRQARVEGAPEEWLARWRRLHRLGGGAWSPELEPVISRYAVTLYWSLRYRGHSSQRAAWQTARRWPDAEMPPTGLAEPAGKTCHVEHRRRR